MIVQSVAEGVPVFYDKMNKVMKPLLRFIHFGRIPVLHHVRALFDDDKIIGKHPIGCAPFTIRPFDADLRPLGNAGPHVNKAQMPRRMTATDLHLAHPRFISGFDIDGRSDSVPVGPTLTQFDL